MRVLSIILISALVYSCTPEKIPLEGNYITSSYEIQSDKPKDEIFTKVVNYLDGISLKADRIDKETGRIFISHAESVPTIEVKPSVLKNASAYFVCAKYRNNSDPDKAKRIRAEYELLYADWTISVQSINGYSVVSITASNIVYHGYSKKAYVRTTKPIPAKDSRSTGVFEKAIADAIK